MEIHSSRSWGWVDWFVIGFRFLGFVISLWNVLGNDLSGQQYGFVLAFVLLALAVPQLFYLPGHIRPAGYIGSEIAVSGAFTLYLWSLSSEVAGTFFVFPFFVICYLCTKKWLYWVAPLCLGVLPILFWLVREYSLQEVIDLILNLSIFGAVGFGFGVFMRQRDQLSKMLRAIEEKNRILEHSLKQVEQMTLLEERSRMSRELHDTVGHSLTASIVAMEAVQALIDRDSQAAKERLGQLIGFNRGHLDTFRQTVHNMAMNELKQPIDVLLCQTADDFSQQTGTVIQVEIQGKTNIPVTEAMKLTMLRCLQEALSNATRHGHAAKVQVTLKLEEKRVTLHIQDNGAGSDRLQEGFGVKGMRARIEALRGTLSIKSSFGEGTAVTCVIPIGV